MTQIDSDTDIDEADNGWLTVSPGIEVDGKPVALSAEGVEGRRFARQGEFVVTATGIEGSLVYAASALLREAIERQGEAVVHLDLLPDRDALDWLQGQQKQRPDAELKTVLSEALPRRFAQRLCEVWLPNRPMKQFNAPQLKEAAALLADWPLVASGTEGYRTAEVTLGGVDTDGVSSSTMMSKHVPGLFFVGEVLDVTGWLGGYNFQWAWASGHAAGMAV